MDLDLGILRGQTQDEAWLTILHPMTGEETTMRIKLMNPDSAAYKAVDSRIKNAGIQSVSRRSKLTVQEIEESGLQLLVGVTTGWENVVFDGVPLDFSPVNARTLYQDFPFIREQVDKFISDRRNFFTS